jgi:hypothetical protein
MKTEIMAKVTPVVSKVARSKIGRAMSEKSPIIFGVLGVGLLIGGTVAACANTLKLEETLDKANDDIRNAENGKSKTIAYVKGVGRVAKLYAPTVALDTLGVVCLGKSHGIMAKRVDGLAAAYEGLRQGYSRYRKNIFLKYGAEADYMAATNSTKEKTTEVDENGKKQKKTIYSSDGHGAATQILFDSYNPNFNYLDMYDGDTYIGRHGDTFTNLYFIKRIEEEANRILLQEGAVSMLEILRLMGFTQANNYNNINYGAARQLGRVYDDSKDPYDPANRINLIPEVWGSREEHEAFIDNAEQGIWLDFSAFQPLSYDCDTWEEFVK